jgi:hypothetical protein
MHQVKNFKTQKFYLKPYYLLKKHHKKLAFAEDYETFLKLYQKP